MQMGQLSLKAKATLILLILCLAYLVSPWDILPFTFFDDLAIVIVGLGIWLIVTLQEGGDKRG